jgi:hypothetical protein
MLKNPNGMDFKNTYVCLGKIEGKKRLREDCLRLRIQIPLAGLQAIEKGYSHKERISWANSSTSEKFAVWGDVNMNDKTALKHEKTEEKKEQEKKEQEIQAQKEAIEKAKQEKIARIKRKKEKKWEKEKQKMAVVDSWEDLL